MSLASMALNAAKEHAEQAETLLAEFKEQFVDSDWDGEWAITPVWLTRAQVHASLAQAYAQMALVEVAP